MSSTLSDSAAEELRRTLLAAARRSCPSWMRDQLEDIVQNAMTRVLALPRAPRLGQWLEPSDSVLARVGVLPIVAGGILLVGLVVWIVRRFAASGG